ncbi:hypothetical protein Pmani_029776 [Petrolisthes manimaculis]|uniref:Uncharacterized protein n=1 Tax=Petrolisthes manimaculis TaxID=1843537 RepID=A0AAE1NZG7_9EUCA|nr:hypothetical protein Pmani_029776 [Petrolisthes manimaculis]
MPPKLLVLVRGGGGELEVEGSVCVEVEGMGVSVWREEREAREGWECLWREEREAGEGRECPERRGHVMGEGEGEEMRNGEGLVKTCIQP